MFNARTLLWLILVAMIGAALLVAQVVIIIGSSLMISSWYADRNTINDVKKFDRLQTENFDSEIISSLIKRINDYGDSLSSMYAIGLTLFLFALPFATLLFLLAIKFRKIYESFSGQVLRLRLSPTSITIIFSMMIAISLIFVSSVAIIEISKNQIRTITLEFLVDSKNASKIIEIFTNDLIAVYDLIVINSLNASYFALVGLFFLLGRISQFTNNERPNIISETFIIVGLFSLLIWLLLFLATTGVDSLALINPKIPNPIQP